MATLVFHVLVVEKVGWKQSGSREARWKAGCGGKKKVNCRLRKSIVKICKCRFREYSGVRGRCVSGMEMNFEGVSCDVAWDRKGDNLRCLICQSLAVLSGCKRWYEHTVYFPSRLIATSQL